MPSERYYRQQATALLSWARATHDKAWAHVLRQRAARELEQAQEGPAAVADLNSLLTDFNDAQLRTQPPPAQRAPTPPRPQPEPDDKG